VLLQVYVSGNWLASFSPNCSRAGHNLVRAACSTGHTALTQPLLLLLLLLWRLAPDHDSCHHQLCRELLLPLLLLLLLQQRSP
jgi:hypothetical protein